MTTDALPNVDLDELAERRRRATILAWGITLIVIGAVAGLGTLATLLDVLNASNGPGAIGRPHASVVPSGLAPTWSGFGTSIFVLTAAASIVWTGIGLCMSRRWARPATQIIASYTIAFALVGVIFCTLLLSSQLDAERDRLMRPRYVEADGTMGSIVGSALGAYLARVALLLAGGVGLPIALYRTVASPAAGKLFARLDPLPTWTDGRPTPALAWAMLAIVSGVGWLIRLDHAAMPIFTFQLTAQPALIAQAILGVVLLWGAWLCARVDRVGWWVTFLLIATLHVSIASYEWTNGPPPPRPTFDEAYHPGMRAKPPTQKQLADVAWIAPTLDTIIAVLVIGFGLHAGRSFAGRPLTRPTLV